ncbi:hypothetical protein KSF81_17405 [Siccirubricoccus sp. G192]|nr:hypothetical protein [Siccirubricoccus sp. G192]
MDTDEIGYLGVAELGALYRARKLSPVEVAKAVLERIERIDPMVNAMMRCTPDHALAAARQSEMVFMRGDTARLLEGIPITIKDLQPTKGVQTDYATAVMQGTIPDVDAPVVTRLLDAGGMLLGKTTSAAEWGWKGVSQAPISGITHNPWGKGLNAGASSSGAGVAAACGYGPLHQGGDGAGSIRMPAHFSGVFGLKPTYGRVPSWPISNNDLATHVGPLTRRVEDAALMLQAIAGPHPWDFTSLETSPQDYAGQLKAANMKGKRIGFTRDLGHASVDGDQDLRRLAGQEAGHPLDVVALVGEVSILVEAAAVLLDQDREVIGGEREADLAMTLLQEGRDEPLAIAVDLRCTQEEPLREAP